MSSSFGSDHLLNFQGTSVLLTERDFFVGKWPCYDIRSPVMANIQAGFYSDVAIKSLN